MSAWEFAIPEGTPLAPAPDAPVVFDAEKARLRALTDWIEDTGEETP